MRAPIPAVADIWPTDHNEPVYDLVPLVPRLGLTVDGTRVAGEVGENPWRFAGDVEHRIEKANVRKPQPAGYHVAGWLLGNVAGVDGTAAEYAEQLDLEGDDWMNLLAVTSCGSMGWGDAGTLYQRIRRADLARGDFTRTERAIGSA